MCKDKFVNSVNPMKFVSKDGLSTVEPLNCVQGDIKSEMKSFKSNENIHKKEGGSYYIVSANKASSVTL